MDAVERYKRRRAKRLDDRGIRLDAEPEQWITVNGNHIPLDKKGRPVGGQKKAIGGENSGFKYTKPLKKTKESNEKSSLESPYLSNWKGGKEPKRYGKPEGFVRGTSPAVLLNKYGNKPQDSLLKSKEGTGHGTPVSGKAKNPGGLTLRQTAKYIGPVQGMSEKEAMKTIRNAKRLSTPNYDTGRDVANRKQNTYLWTYTTHGQDHVNQVMKKTNQAVDALEHMQSKKGMPIAHVDRKALLYAAQMHDTGMDGGHKVDTYTDDGSQLRKDHGINSALHVLENGNELKKDGVNPSKVAFMVMAHTKSQSGIKDLGNPDDFQTGIERMKAAVEEYEKATGKKLEFDPAEIFDGGKPTKENIGEMSTAIAALRLGDANREADIPLRSQSGGEYKIDKMPPKGCKDRTEEQNNAVISITDDEGRHELSFDDPKMKQVKDHPFSKGVVLGERNMVKCDAVYNEKHGTIQEEITLRDGDAVPFCTADAILERIGELNTVNGIPRAIKIKMPGIKNFESLSPETRKAYRNLFDKRGELDDIIIEFDNGEKHSFKKHSQKAA